MDRFEIALKEEINRARIEADESHKLAMNSYGAGYDAGYRDGLSRALQMIHNIDLYEREQP
jgi:hypothetical protein